MKYENLLREAAQQQVYTYEKPMPSTVKGLYSDKIIWINRGIPTRAEKACILAEELGHHHTSSGNSLNQRTRSNRKQEIRARTWAYEKLMPLTAIVEAHQNGIGNRHELAEYLGITEPFVTAAINRYQEKYGLSVGVGSYTVCFEPLGVLELFE